MEQMQYDLLFRWSVGLGIDDQVWEPAVFTRNRDADVTQGDGGDPSAPGGRASGVGRPLLGRRHAGKDTALR